MMKKGYIQIYTGNGKGKTTAALGLSLRAAGHGYRVGIIQFMKDFPYGELRALKRFDDLITIRRFGNDRFVFKKEQPSDRDKNEASQGLFEAREMMQSGRYEIIILDEICVAIYFQLVDEKQVLEVIDMRPEDVELVLTGRYCSHSLIKKADLVTEMNEIRHYYQKGVKARNGIES
jgi:cob(I)alamin adenosyltransferase